MSIINIAIDGPSGAGKSTIAKIVAKSLGLINLDTGAMYRAVALKAIHDDIDTLDHDKLTKMMETIDIKVCYIDSVQKVILDGVDVSDNIRTPQVSIGASNVASIPEVRIKMVELQRAISRESGVVMDGRDIGTYVLPHADLKVFLTASVEERAKRRYTELIEGGKCNVTFNSVFSDIELRDKNDSTRSFAPLAKAEDAIEIDSTFLSIEEVAKKIISMAKSKGCC